MPNVCSAAEQSAAVNTDPGTICDEITGLVAGFDSRRLHRQSPGNPRAFSFASSEVPESSP